MKHERTADKGATINGGAYYTSLEEMQTPKHQAMQGVLKAISSKKTKAFREALKNAEDQGWNISEMVIQDSLDSWFTLGSFLASRPYSSYGKLFVDYLSYPGVNLEVQEGQTSSSYRYWLVKLNKSAADNQAIEALKMNVRQPISHIFMRQWSEYLPIIKKKPGSSGPVYGEKQYADRHKLAHTMFNKMTSLGLDWTSKDEYGNTLCHVLAECQSTEALKMLLPWLKDLGVSMAESNHDGLTPSDVARLRIERNQASTWNKSTPKEVAEFKEVISIMEKELLAATTSHAMGTGQRIRL